MLAYYNIAMAIKTIYYIIASRFFSTNPFDSMCVFSYCVFHNSTILSYFFVVVCSSLLHTVEFNSIYLVCVQYEHKFRCVFFSISLYVAQFAFVAFSSAHCWLCIQFVLLAFFSIYSLQTFSIENSLSNINVELFRFMEIITITIKFCSTVNYIK